MAKKSTPTKPELPGLIPRTTPSIVKSTTTKTSRPGAMVSKSGFSNGRAYAQGGKIKK